MRLLLLLFVCLSTSLVHAETFMVKGREIVLNPPPGFALVTEDMTALWQASRQLDDPSNDTIAFFIPVAAIPAAKAGQLPSYERYMMVKSTKDLAAIDISKRMFGKLKSTIKKERKEIMAQAEVEAKQQMENANLGLAFSGMEFLDVHAETEHSLSFSMLIDIEMGDEKVHQASTACMALLNNRIISLYAYAPKDELEWTRTAAGDYQVTAIADNPSKAVGGFFDWGKVLNKALIGAVVGGSFAFLFSLFKRKEHEGGTDLSED